MIFPKDKDQALEIAEFCDLCGQSSFIQEISVNGWNLVKCQSCGLVCTSPRYSREYLKKLYHDHYYEQNPHYFSSQEKYPLKDEILLAKFLKKKIWGEKEGVPRFLDVGCGAGRLVQAFFAAGWDAMGIDISQAVLEAAVARGLNLRNEMLDSLPHSQFDLIVAFHVLEHVHSPKQFLNTCLELLVSKGYLLLEVPNYECRNARRLREKWPYLYPDTHIYQFTSKTLQRFLSEAKFKILRSEAVHGRGPLEDTRFIPPRKWKKRISFREVLFEFRHLVYWSATGRQMVRHLVWHTFGYGEFFRVLARKNS